MVIVKKPRVLHCLEAGKNVDNFRLRRRKWQPTPVFLPGDSHGQRSLAGYSLWHTRVGHDLVTKILPLYSITL